ncbi:MAG: type II secretion system protein GspC [Cocleimonas sp.]
MSATLESKPKLPGFISLLLVIALGISLAKLMWLVITPQQQLILTPQNNDVSSISQKKETNYGKLIADQHIFGEVLVKKAPIKPKATPKVVVKPAVPKVKLNAKLHGIVAYKSQKSLALISNNNSKQKVYGEGDALQEGVLISKILPTKVVVDNNGTDEELLLPVKGNKSTKRSRSKSNQSLSSLPGVNLPTSLPGAAATASNDLPDLNQFRQEILANPSKLTDIVRASPAIINGQFIGFRVRSGKKRKLFRQLKFRPNDIITEINGIVLDDANKGIEVLGQLQSASSLSIKVKRGNQEVYIDHSF